MLSIFDNLYDKNKIIDMLLKHDAIIFGSLIRDIITNQFNKNMKYTVVAIIPNNYQKIIERNLYKIVEDKINYNFTPSPMRQKLIPVPTTFIGSIIDLASKSHAGFLI